MFLNAIRRRHDALSSSRGMRPASLVRPISRPSTFCWASLREDKALTTRFLRSHASVESIRMIEAHTTIREKAASTSVDLPLLERVQARSGICSGRSRAPGP